MKPSRDNNFGIAVCLPIGGYKSETFAQERLQWLAQTIEDLNSQSLQPEEVIVAVNGNIDPKILPQVHDILNGIKAPLDVLPGKYDFSAAENFDRAVQHSSSPYFSFWSDHDLHAHRFLETLIELHKSKNNLALTCSLFNHVDENGKLVKEISSICDAIEAVGSRPAERLQVLIRANLLGAVYGIINRAKYQACSRRMNSLGPDILLSYELAKHGGIVIIDDILWAERSRSASTAPARVRHAEFFDSTELIAGIDTQVTHHLLTSYQILRDSKYFNLAEQRSLRRLSMRVCERRFISFACVRELKNSAGLICKSITLRDTWLLFSSLSVFGFQIYWLLYLAFAGVIFDEARTALESRDTKSIKLKQKPMNNSL